MSLAQAGRHLPREAVASYLAGSPSAIVIPGSPPCRIDFDPPRREMALRTPHAGSGEPDLSSFEYVSTRVISEQGTRWDQVVVQYGANGHEAYLLLSDIADMIQQYQLRFASAIPSALATFGDLLARSGSLSPERQTGLYGELLLLESCLQSMESGAAVEAWKGFAPHEHDFVFPGAAFEVKTTTTERRRHIIGSLEQLDPSPGTALWLISIQLTAATSTTGRTLTQLVDDTINAAGTASPALEASLEQAGWRERDRASYLSHHKLRSIPAAYLVDGTFPVLNRRAVDQGCARPELIAGATYTIDVTTLHRGDPPQPAVHFAPGRQ
ncbi:PD-(D/E)XK motif protein [Actinoplanes sp. NPDC049599]|uniref:PD-(D/E)XK motif protein n=1 Tax=Actinoplanes sp. NPDC049599 TaxID=3363903 RepID=UPI00379168E4